MATTRQEANTSNTFCHLVNEVVIVVVLEKIKSETASKINQSQTIDKSMFEDIIKDESASQYIKTRTSAKPVQKTNTKTKTITKTITKTMATIKTKTKLMSNEKSK